MEKKVDKIQNLILVTKENFRKCFIDFKNILKSEVLEYIIFNNEISTSNEKYMEKYGEIIFSEFTICYKGKEIENNKNQNNLLYITYLIPSIKYHKFSQEEFASFNPMILQSLSNNGDLYSLDNIFKSNSISYENINEKENLEKTFTSILKEGKPFTDENKKSYNYFPKAIELPSKKFQKRFEDIIKYFTELNFNEEEKVFFINSDIYETNFKLLNRLLNFKWNLIFNNLEENAFKLIVDRYKITILRSKLKIKQDFISMVNKLIKFFEDTNISNYMFDIEIEDKYFNEGLLKNWKLYLEIENKYIDFKYNISYKEKKKIVVFNISISKGQKKSGRLQNIIKFLKFIIETVEKYNNDNNNKEFILDDITFKKINKINLFPEKTKKRIEFSYHIIPKIDQTKFKLDNTKEYYKSKMIYKTLLLRNCNNEEILFGQKIKPYLEDLFNIKNNDHGIKTIPIFFGIILKNLLSSQKFNEKIKLFFSKFEFSIFDQKKDKFFSVHYIKNEKFKNEEFEDYLKSILELAMEIKKNYIINEEIGLSLFYKELFSIKNINLYFLNLKDNIFFSIRKLLLKNDLNYSDNINAIISNMSLYDLSLICKEEKINIYNEYNKIKEDKNLKNLPFTQKIHLIIQNNKFLQNRSNLINYKNRFYSDEKKSFENKPFYIIEKDKFYNKLDDIINLLKNKTDFTLSSNIGNNKMIQINFIDSTKFNDLDNIINELNNI